MVRKKYTREIAAWVRALRFEDIPDRVVEECKNQLLSVLGAMFAGSRTEGGAAVVRAVRGWSAPGGCALIPGGGRVTLLDSITANTALSMALDYDDYMLAGHTGHSAVLAPLALAQLLDVDGREFVCAQVIANEVEARIGASVMLGPLNGQMWGFIHAAGAACAAARLLRLDEDQIASALGIALAHPNRTTIAGFLGGDGKLLTASASTAAGVSAAFLAREGLAGTPDILENPDGFCSTFSFTPLLPALTGLGRVWLSDTLSYKQYPGCAYIDAPVDCVFEIMKNNPGLETGDIQRVDVHASMMTQRLDEFVMPYVRHVKSAPTTLNFYTPYNVAVALADGALGPEQFEPERIADQDLWKFTKKIRVNHDIKYTTMLVDNITNVLDIKQVVKNLSLGTVRELLGQMGFASPLLILGRGREIGELLREGRRALQKFAGVEDDAPAPPDDLLAVSTENFRMAFGARVEIELRSGKKLVHEQEVPFGAAGWSLEEKRLAVIRKFEREAAAVLDDEAANSAFGAILGLDTLDNAALRDLVEDCAAKPVRA